MRRLLLTVAVACLALAAPAAAQTLQLVPYGGQDFAAPYYVTGAPGDPSRVFVVEGGGVIRLVKDGVTQPTPFLDLSGPVCFAPDGCGGESGLFSMAPAPDYATSGLFYVYFTRAVNAGEHELVVEEFRRSANPDLADPSSGRILVQIPHPGARNHNGGQLQFGPDKQLYMATGDGGTGGANAQSPGSLLGKLLLVNRTSGGASIAAFGLRNPYRFSFDRSTGDLTIGDVGETAWEEIDFRPEGTGTGVNYGWPCYEGPAVFNGCPASNYAPPVLWYGHSGGAAVSGGYVIRDSALPTWTGRYIYADTYASLGNALRSAVLANGAASGDAPTGLSASTVVSFGQDACGHIYVASANGPVYRIQPTSGAFPCKTAPALSLDASSARDATRLGAILIKVGCDEDCDVNATGAITLGRSNKRKHAAAARKRRKKKAAQITGQPISTRLQLGPVQTLRLRLSRKQTKRLRGMLRNGKKVFAQIVVSVTGGGGGTDTKSATVKLRKKAKKKGKKG